MRVDLPTPLAPEAKLPIDLDDPCLDTPAVLVDLDIAEANIAKMANFAQRQGLALRPHVKTHKSTAMAKRQLAAGAVGACVAKVTEAEVMVSAGISDILIAYPIVGQRKLEGLTAIIPQALISVVADSEEVLDGYQQVGKNSKQQLTVLVEVDTGMHRVGMPPREVLKLTQAIDSSPVLRFGGILTHAGHAHDAENAAGVAATAVQEAEIMGHLKSEIEGLGIEVPCVSAGSTLTSPYLSASQGITEIRPGTYIYNDLRTLSCWSCTFDSIAASVLTTVVSIGENRVTVDAGNKTLTLTQDPAFGYGHILGSPEAVFTRLSEEHGVLTAPTKPTKVGDRVQVLPIHVCVWMDLQAEVYGHRNGQIVERLPLQSMRHSL